MAVRTVDTLKPNNSTTATGKGTFPVAKADDVWFNDGESLEEKVQNGTIGASIQVVAMPTANIKNFGKIVQYIGITDTDYTNGHFYKCVTTDDGQGGLIYKWIHQNVDEISGKQDTIDSSHKLSSDLVDDADPNVNKFVTSAEKTQIATNKNSIDAQQNTAASGGNGYAIINGIRVYVSATQPTGARAGDLWIGG